MCDITCRDDFSHEILWWAAVSRPSTLTRQLLSTFVPQLGLKQVSLYTQVHLLRTEASARLSL